MRLVLVLLFLAASIVAPGSSPVVRAQDSALETYSGLGWSISWNPKTVELIATSEALYEIISDGCNVTLAYPRFTLCARSFDRATYPYSVPAQYDQGLPSDNVWFIRDKFHPNSVPVPDEVTSRPAFESDDRAWQLFGDPAGLTEEHTILDDEAIYIDVRRLSPDETVTVVVTGLTVEEFEAADDEVSDMLASIEVREPNFTDPTWGWSIEWDHEQLRPSVFPLPDGSMYLTEYADTYSTDRLRIRIILTNYTLDENEDPASMDPVTMLNAILERTVSPERDIVSELPEGYEALQTSGPDRASGFFLPPNEYPEVRVPDNWGLVDIRVLVPGEAVLMTMVLWDEPHSEELLPVIREFLTSISIPS